MILRSNGAETGTQSALQTTSCSASERWKTMAVWMSKGREGGNRRTDRDLLKTICRCETTEAIDGCSRFVHIPRTLVELRRTSIARSSVPHRVALTLPTWVRLQPDKGNPPTPRISGATYPQAFVGWSVGLHPSFQTTVFVGELSGVTNATRVASVTWKEDRRA